MKGSTLFALAAGAVAGAVTGLTLGVLFAPDKGSETRRKVKKAASHGLDELENLRETVQNHSGDLKKDAREKIVEQLDRLEKALRNKPEDVEEESAASEEPEEQFSEA